jgi:hypothetical protein
MLRLVFATLLLLTPVAAQRFGSLTRQFLELTESQNRQLREIIEPYYAWIQVQQDRSGQVELEIQEEAVKTPLDAMALGVRFAELEAIRRESVERLAEVVRRRQAVLTPAQWIRVAALEEAYRLRDILQDANCESILRTDPERACGVISVNLNTPTGPAVPTATIWDPSVPFDPTEPIRRYLELTPAQSAAYLRNLSVLGERQRAAASRVACGEQEARRELAASPLLPARIGVAKANSIAARRLIASLQEEAVADNQALLNPAQLLRLQALQQASELVNTVNLARQYSLLLPAASRGPVFLLSGIFGADPVGFCAFPINEAQ